MKKLFGYDSDTGVVEHFQKEEGKIIISKSQDVENTLKHNQIDRINNGSWKGDMHKVASIPVIVAEKWINELRMAGRNTSLFCAENKPFLIAKLNSLEFQKLRTKEGVI